MKNVLFVISFILTIPNSYCQSFSSNTIPEQINGGSPLVLGIENSNDVKIVCEIIYNDTISVITNWRLLSGGDTFLLRFHGNGTANNEASQPFSVTGEPTSQGPTQSNLTIIDFTNSLDMSVMECFTSQITFGNFTFRLIDI